jgi:hypothetical protein
VTWPGRPQEHIPFDTEAEAQRWIKNDSAAWVSKHPNSK